MTLPFPRCLLLCLVMTFCPGISGLAVDESSLTQLGVNVAGVNYYTTPFFANGLWLGNGWLEFTGSNWGTRVATYGNVQFDANGFPRYLNAGTKLRAIVYGLGVNYATRPSTWPQRGTLALGKFVVTWKGDADIRFTGATFIAAESSGAATGRLVDGRRVYRQTSMHSNITVEDINAADPITDIKVWLPDPADRENQTLEGQVFHPTAVSRIANGPWGWVRCMDWVYTNASPQQDWSDRRLPTYGFQSGILNPRSPAPGFAGDRPTGVAFEHMVAFCNAVNKDMWITVPHLATPDFITKLAQLIAFGSDGVNPYSAPQASPVYAPLNSSLRLFVEYSNEIWSNGNSFAQGNWAEDQAAAAGISKAQFNARRFCDTWAVFQSVFGGSSRLVKVAAVFTGNQSYTQTFLNEIKTYGAALSPAQEPDLIAPTTYFGNGIQDWAYATAQEQAGTTDPWFLKADTFDAGGGVLRPVSVAASDGYWTGNAISRHLSQTFDQWKRRILSGATQTGGGPDATGLGGGLEVWLHPLALTTFQTRKPLVSYEGGPSLYSDYMDGGDSRDDGITTFLELLNRQPEMKDVYRLHLNMAKAKGLRTHGVFVDSGNWGKYGQWGHLEYLDQTPSTSPKWSFLLDWEAEMSSLRHIDDVAGTAPQFVTAAKLPTAVWGLPYSQSITTSGGEGGRTIHHIGQVIVRGLSTSTTGATATIAGSPAVTGNSFVYLRVQDGEGDPAWRTFYFKTVGGPRVLVESNFEGTNPAMSRPWTATYTQAAGYSFTGWNKGTGITAASGDDALVSYQTMASSEADSTLAAAIAANHYWTASLQPPSGQAMDLRGAEIRFTVRRIDYHAPRRYAVFTSLSGFTSGSEVFASPRFGSTVDEEFAFHLPDTAAYAALDEAVEFRLVGFLGQYAGHKTSITGFKVTRRATAFDSWVESVFTPSEQVMGTDTTELGDPDGDGLENLLEWACDLNPTTVDAVSTMIDAQEEVLEFRYTRRVDAVNAGVIFRVEWSETLTADSWSSVDVTQQVLSDDGQVQQVKATMPVGTLGRRFVRLKLLSMP